MTAILYILRFCVNVLFVFHSMEKLKKKKSFLHCTTILKLTSGSHFLLQYLDHGLSFKMMYETCMETKSWEIISIYENVGIHKESGLVG